jgi:phage shock protein E
MKTTFILLASFMMMGAGFSETAPAKGGLVKIEQAEKQIAEGIQLLDVRTLEEWNEGYIKGAKRATVTEEGFLERAKAQLDPTKPLLVYCRSGKRSAQAVAQLREAGFSEVHDIAGGILAWEAAGKPLVVEK